jgi:hypothetical protein
MKSSIFSDIITGYTRLKVYLCSGGACRLHLQGRRISQARNQSESKCQSCPLLSAIRRLNFSALHGVICQKTELFDSIRSSRSARCPMLLKECELLLFLLGMLLRLSIHFLCIITLHFYLPALYFIHSLLFFLFITNFKSTPVISHCCWQAL